ncbi:MAG: hypothetical protein ACI9FN_002164 [Saprospiraceae bacterium]|jgi:hypothetical protein
MSPLRKVRIIRKWKILDDIFIFRTSVMPGHQGVENNGNIAKRAVSRYYDFLEWTQTYTLTGPSSISYADMASTISRFTDRNIAYVQVASGAHNQGMKAAGLPDWLADDHSS